MKWRIFILFLGSLKSCFGQENAGSSYCPPYTCTTTTTLCHPRVIPENPLPTSEVSPARQGKKGPAGLKGSKGEKGDPCECNVADEEEISELRREVAEIKQNNRRLEERLENISRPIPAGWIQAPNGYLYLFHKHGIVGGWTAAREFCRSLGGDIAMIGIRDAQIERFLINNFVQYLGPAHIWIGFTDEQEEGTWLWADGIPVSGRYTNWAANEPNNAYGNQNCGILNYGFSFKWDDYNCSPTLRVICEKEP